MANQLPTFDVSGSVGHDGLNGTLYSGSASSGGKNGIDGHSGGDATSSTSGSQAGSIDLSLMSTSDGRFKVIANTTDCASRKQSFRGSYRLSVQGNISLIACGGFGGNGGNGGKGKGGGSGRNGRDADRFFSGENGSNGGKGGHGGNGSSGSRGGNGGHVTIRVAELDMHL